jgi:hypothetical protein
LLCSHWPNKFNSPFHDERTPDILLKVNTGVIFTTVHGGMNEDDVHVALVFSNPLLPARQVMTPVLTQQVAPTILRSLGLEPGASGCSSQRAHRLHD